MSAQYRLITIVVVTFLLAQCRPAPSWKEEVDAIFSQSFSDEIPGGVVLIMKENEILFAKAYGVADINTKEKITTHTLFNTGSISKTFVSHVILELEHEGKLSLNDSLAKYFVDFTNPAIARQVKIRHLLTHTSGLPDNRRDFLDSVFLLTAKDEANFAPIKKAEALNFEPGSQYEYSNPAFNGLALIIEKVTGKKWQAVVQEKIFDPAGMKRSVITDGAFPENGVSHAYLKTEGGYMEKDYGEEPTFAAAGNGGVWSSAAELALYEQALRKAVFQDAAVIEEARSVQLFSNWKSKEPPFIGYSWFIGKTGDGWKMIYHTGTQGGFYGDFVSIPEKGILYVMLCNVPTPQEEKREAVLRVLKKHRWLD
jgi:CubicO group peptidase (beta-lactamase class C family)